MGFSEAMGNKNTAHGFHKAMGKGVKRHSAN